MTQNNLGVVHANLPTGDRVYGDLPTEDRGDNLKRAIG